MPIYKLHFTTPVHFGDDSGGNLLTAVRMTFRGDVLFSALYMQGNAELFRQAVASGELWFSDAFPYCGDILYLPKPIGLWNRERNAGDPSMRKLFKKLQYIPMDHLTEFLHGMSDPRKLDCTFAVSHDTTRVNRRDFEDPLPYQVSAMRFVDGCGLYVIVQSLREEILTDFEQRLTLLSADGIGGRRSSGWGKFTWERFPIPDTLKKGLEDEEAPCQMLLSTALPRDNDLENAMEGACYLLVRRGGFTYSPLTQPTKKRTLYLFGAGSTFPKRFEGQLLDVGLNMPHPVWRYAEAGFMGVRI